MAAAVAAASAGEPLSPDELLPKAEAEKAEEELEDDVEDELDETLSERLWGLTEMFPERVRSAAGATFDLSLFVAQIFQSGFVDWDHLLYDSGSSCCL
ncbi:Mitochondrial import receptor subunit TOM22 homolog [Lemmus lemmus]